MRRAITLVLLAVGAVASTMIPGIAAAPPLDVERELVARFGFSAAEVEQVRAGQVVAKTLPSREATEIAVFGAVRIPDDRENLLYWIRDIERFRKGAELGVSRKLSSPPTIDDFADLALDSGELAALQKCKPGDCGLRLGDRAIAGFRTGVDWAASDAGQKANLIARRLLLGYAEAYLRGGDGELGASCNEKKPRLVAEDFRELIRGATNLNDLASPLAKYLEGFPKAPLADVEQVLYWAKGGVGPDSSITLHHLVIHREAGGAIYVVDKQLYASRYTDASLVRSLAGNPGRWQRVLSAGGRARTIRAAGGTRCAGSARAHRGRIALVHGDLPGLDSKEPRDRLTHGRSAHSSRTMEYIHWSRTRPSLSALCRSVPSRRYPAFSSTRADPGLEQ